MAVTHGRVSVGTSPTPIVEGDVYGTSVAVTNLGDETVYVGNEDVTTSEGFPVDAGATVGLPLGRSDELYGIVAAATEEVAFLLAGDD